MYQHLFQVESEARNIQKPRKTKKESNCTLLKADSRYKLRIIKLQTVLSIVGDRQIGSRLEEVKGVLVHFNPYG